jgi:hypothetical protein
MAALIPLPARAEGYFRAEQALPPSHSVDVLVWQTDPAAPDSAWDCARADSSAIRPATCRVEPYRHPSSAPGQYLYWAFLNIRPGADRGDLAARDADDEAAFRSWKRPLLALKAGPDSCLYLVVQRDQAAPLAGGRIVCSGLSQCFEAVAKDLEGKDHFIARPEGAGAPKKVMRQGAFSHDPPHALDIGLDGAVALAIPLSGDQQADPNVPYSTGSEAFDFEDYADSRTPPIAVRATALFRDIVGLRLGYAYSSYSLSSEMRSAISQAISGQGGTLDDWKIARKDWTFELLLAYPTVGNSAELPLYGMIGFGRTEFNETAVINGREYPDQGLLANETGFLLGGGAQMRFPYFFLGIEANAYIKDFAFRKATTQPDGSGSEIQIRIYAGSYWRYRFGED